MPSLARQGRKIYSLANSNYHYWWTAVRKLRVGFNTFAATNHHRRQSFFGIFRPQAVSFLFIISILCRHSSFTLLNRCHIALYFFLSSHVLSAIFLSDVRLDVRQQWKPYYHIYIYVVLLLLIILSTIVIYNYTIIYYIILCIHGNTVIGFHCRGE